MTTKTGARAIGAPLLAALIVFATAGTASAQYGLGMGGWGGGLYNPMDGSQVQNAVNQRSLMQGQAAYNSRQTSLSAPRFNQRDDSFYDKYDLATREAMISRVARNPGLQMSTAFIGGSMERPAAPTPTPAPAATTPAPVARPVSEVVRLGNFFDKMRQLVWPSGASTEGDLGVKRQAADLAAQTVLNEFQSRGIASLESTASARRQLVAYGQPALLHAREHSTPAIADSFHAFLLTLYANLGDAYTIPASKPR